MQEALAMELVAPTICQAINRFTRRSPQLDKEELFGEAQIVALKAIRSFEEGRDNLVPWVWLCVWRWLCASTRNGKWKRRFAAPAIHRPQERLPCGQFDLRRLLIELSDDAAQAVNLVLDRQPNRATLYRTLRKEFGWEVKQIAQVFQEIKEAL